MSESLVKPASIYFLGGIGTRIVPFLLLPILTRLLSAEDYGIIGTYQASLTLVMAFVGLNTNAAIIRNYRDLVDADFTEYIGSSLAVLSLTFIVSIIFISIFSSTLSRVVGIPFEWLLTIPLAALGAFAFNTMLSVFRVRGNALAFGGWNTASATVNILCSLILVLTILGDWRGRVLGLSFSHLVFGLAAIAILVRSGDVAIPKSTIYIRDAVVFGSPLVLHKLAAWMTMMLNRPMLSQLAGFKATGLFSVGCMIASAVVVVETAFEQAWTPWLYSKMKEQSMRSKVLVVRVTYAYFAGLLLLAIIVTIVARIVLPLAVGPEFEGVEDFVLLVSLAYAANGMKKVCLGFILYSKRTEVIALLSSGIAILSIILNYYLISTKGAIGAAQAMLATLGIAWLATWLTAGRLSPMPWLSALLPQRVR